MRRTIKSIITLSLLSASLLLAIQNVYAGGVKPLPPQDYTIEHGGGTASGDYPLFDPFEYIQLGINDKKIVNVGVISNTPITKSITTARGGGLKCSAKSRIPAAELLPAVPALLGIAIVYRMR